MKRCLVYQMKTQPEMNPDRLSNVSGQAMVEFAILLIIIMSLCSGMLYSSRLLTFEFWAQQEARFIAFEQTWVPSEAGTNAIDQLDDTEYLHRPELLDRLDADKDSTDDGDIHDLLAFRSAVPAESIWKSKVDDYLPGSEDLTFLPIAYASQVIREVKSFGGTYLPQRDEYRTSSQDYLPGNKAERKYIELLERGEFGEKFCTAMVGLVERYGIEGSATPFSERDCASKYNQGFGEHIAENLDVRSFFLEYGEQIEWGLDARDGLQVALEREAASQFYSFFDTTVRTAFTTAGVYLPAQYISMLSLASDNMMQRLLTEGRYIGSIIAMGLIDVELISTGAQNVMSRDADAQQAAEEDMQGILFLDATNAADTGANLFWLWIDYLPLPPDFTLFFGNLFSGLMKNVLDQETDLWDPMIEQSNKMAEVTYDAAQGLFPAARRRWNTDNKTLTSRFYLVTQPWHITRRENGTGAYRQLGTEDDDKDDDESDEALIRRRVFGLYLFPARVSELLSPITGLIPGGAGDALEGVFSVFEGFDSIISVAKDFLLDNPLNDLLEAINQMPWLDDNLDFSFPEWPAVRPAAYPRTTEIEGDLTTGSARNFADFVQEQHDNNPDPDPEYHDD